MGMPSLSRTMEPPAGSGVSGTDVQPLQRQGIHPGVVNGGIHEEYRVVRRDRVQEFRVDRLVQRGQPHGPLPPANPFAGFGLGHAARDMLENFLNCEGKRKAAVVKCRHGAVHGMDVDIKHSWHGHAALEVRDFRPFTDEFVNLRVGADRDEPAVGYGHRIGPGLGVC